MIFWVASALLLATQAPVGASKAREVVQVERDLEVADGEMRRIDDQYKVIPDLFSTGDRGERLTWGEIYYLTREYQRASLLLFGVVEPRANDTVAVERQPDYADALYYLADSLFLLGNHSAARAYFEKLLALPGHSHAEEAILRLMELGAEENRFDLVDQYYATYTRTAKTDVPGHVRYLRGKSLFFAHKDDAALAELAQVPPSDGWALRSRYLMGAAMVRKGDFDTALQRFTEVAFAKPMGKGDKDVKEMAHLARGRLHYERDQLGESIDAYQEIGYDSPLLTTMLYEVTWTYVRRGQLALRGSKGDNKTELERREDAKVEYEKALAQMEDLKALEPDSDRAAEIDILAGNLRLQRNEFEKAQALFTNVLDQHSAAEKQLADMMADHSQRERLLQDILAMATGGLTVDTKLPALAARRAANNEDVAKALSVFKEIRKSKDDITATTKILENLQAQLSPDNPNRTELFKPLQAGVERSTTLGNTLAQLRARAVAVERTLARPSPELAQKLHELQAARAQLELSIAALPQTRDAVVQRRKRFADRLASIDRTLHVAELDAAQRRAELNAVDFMVSRDPAPNKNPVKAELRKNQVRQAQVELQEIEARAADLRDRIAVLKREIATMGGRGSGEDQLRTAYAESFEQERALLAQARDPAQAALYSRIDGVMQKIDGVATRNAAFRARLDGLVEERLAGARTLLAAESEAISTYLSVVATIDASAAQVRDRATEVALERVRQDIARIVMRADVGVVDTSFARKQAETEKIGQMQRARAAELTDLTQAYADLTKDEAP